MFWRRNITYLNSLTLPSGTDLGEFRKIPEIPLGALYVGKELWEKKQRRSMQKIEERLLQYFIWGQWWHTPAARLQLRAHRKHHNTDAPLNNNKARKTLHVWMYINLVCCINSYNKFVGLGDMMSVEKSPSVEIWRYCFYFVLSWFLQGHVIWGDMKKDSEVANTETCYTRNH